jgi:hypothetical protein
VSEAIHNSDDDELLLIEETLLLVLHRANSYHLGAEHFHDFCIRIFGCKVTDLTLAGFGISRKTLKDCVKLLLRHQDILVSSTDIFLTGFGLPFVFRAKPTVFCCMIRATAVCAFFEFRRLWLGRWLFVFGLVPTALFLKLGIVGLFDLATFRFECLSDFEFLKIVNSALKIKLIKFNVCTKNDRLPFFRFCLVENLD